MPSELKIPIWLYLLCATAAIAILGHTAVAWIDGFPAPLLGFGCGMAALCALIPLYMKSLWRRTHAD